MITATYNSAATVRDTLNSVAVQQYGNVEHIIVDGDSDDDTLNIVKEFPHITKVLSEKDRGLYDAMNKGIACATGDIIGILNSDDIYMDENVLAKVSDTFANAPIDGVYGDLQYVDQDNIDKVVRNWTAGAFKRRNFYYGWMPPHPTFFVRREVYERFGNFNLALKSSADYEIMLRFLFKNTIAVRYIPEVLVKMRTGGMSNASFRNRLRANREDRMAWKLNGLHPYFFTLFLKPARKVKQFIIR